MIRIINQFILNPILTGTVETIKICSTQHCWKEKRKETTNRIRIIALTFKLKRCKLRVIFIVGCIARESERCALLLHFYSVRLKRRIYGNGRELMSHHRRPRETERKNTMWTVVTRYNAIQHSSIANVHDMANCTRVFFFTDASISTLFNATAHLWIHHSGLSVRN